MCNFTYFIGFAVASAFTMRVKATPAMTLGVHHVFLFNSVISQARIPPSIFCIALYPTVPWFVVISPFLILYACILAQFIAMTEIT
jgi:hypothetical protein